MSLFRGSSPGSTSLYRPTVPDTFAFNVAWFRRYAPAYVLLVMCFALLTLLCSNWYRLTAACFLVALACAHWATDHGKRPIAVVGHLVMTGTFVALMVPFIPWPYVTFMTVAFWVDDWLFMLLERKALVVMANKPPIRARSPLRETVYLVVWIVGAALGGYGIATDAPKCWLAYSVPVVPVSLIFAVELYIDWRRAGQVSHDANAAQPSHPPANQQ
jgi:hypothetical protein